MLETEVAAARVQTFYHPRRCFCCLRAEACDQIHYDNTMQRITVVKRLTLTVIRLLRCLLRQRWNHGGQAIDSDRDLLTQKPNVDKFS